MTKEELYKVTDILNDVLSNYLRGSEAEEVIAKLEESVEDSELIKEEPIEDLEKEYDKYIENDGNEPLSKEYFLKLCQHFSNWQKEQLLAKAVEGKVLANGMGNPILHLWDKGRHLIDKKVKVIVIKEDKIWE